MNDVKLAWRLLLKSPAYTAVAVLTLGLAIGATTAIYSVVNAVLLRPLPYPDPDRLVAVWETHPSFERMSVSYPDYLDWKQQSKSFSDIGAMRNESFNLTGGERPERLQGLMFSASLMPTLGIKPALGRNFTPEEDVTNGPPVVIISHGLWQRRLGGDPQAVGKTLPLSGTLFTVVGVLPPNFLLSPKSDVIVPIERMPKEMRNRGNHPGILAIGRLRDGVTVEEARAEMKTVGRAIALAQGEDRQVRPALRPYHDDLVDSVKSSALVLMGSVIFVLLVAIANVASLALARGAARRKEMAVRAALGAGKARLLRQVLVESSIVALIGGALGVLFAMWGVDLLGSMRPDAIPSEAVITVDRGVLLFTLAVSVLSGLAFGILPALAATRATDLADALRDGDLRSTAGSARTRARSTLVVAEVAMALILLTGAGLSIKTFLKLSRMDTGYDTHGVVTMNAQLAPERGKDPAALRAFLLDLGARMGSIRGVEHASLGTGLPLLGASETSYGVVGEPPLPPGQTHMAVYYQVDEAYLATMGIRLIAGRWLRDGDDEKAHHVIVIDQHMAQTVFKGQNPLGARIRIFDDKVEPAEVVGVVDHVVHYGPGEKEAAADQFYYPWRQTPDEFLYPSVRYLGITLRTAPGAPMDEIVAAARDQVAQIDADLPLFAVQTMVKAFDDSLAARRFAMLLLAVFAAVALLLAVVGLYSVMSYLVTQRTHELGIRVALGARPRDVERLVVGHGAKLVGAGLVLGVAGALLLRKLVAAVLAGIEPTDPLVLAVVAVLLATTALLASWLPARRAARVDPMIALRSE